MKYISPHDFYTKTIGKAIDIDHDCGVQCVDLFKYYSQLVNGWIGFTCSPSGYAHSLWENRKNNGLLKYFDEVAPNNLQDGDWCIWADKSPECPVSHVAMFRKNDKNGRAIFLGQNQGGKKEATQISISKAGILGAFRTKATPYKYKYRGHVQGTGWQNWVTDGQTAGTTGQGKRLEAIQIDTSIEVYAKAHIQQKGWVDFGKINKDTIIGTTGKGLRLEALQLKGNFQYRVHIAKVGWTTWTNADGVITLGSVGQGLSIEAIQIK